MAITGECFCGAVTYQVDGKLWDGKSCHCSRCRKALSRLAACKSPESSPAIIYSLDAVKGTLISVRESTNPSLSSLLAPHRRSGRSSWA